MEVVNNAVEEMQHNGGPKEINGAFKAAANPIRASDIWTICTKKTAMLETMARNR
jgi:hypothetical protein